MLSSRMGGTGSSTPRLAVFPSRNYWPTNWRRFRGSWSTDCLSGWRRPPSWPARAASGSSSALEIECDGATKMIMSKTPVRTLRAALSGLALLALGGATAAQQEPSAEAIETARQIIVLKSGDTLFNALIPGVIEQGKSMFEQQNPMLSKDLRDVATRLRTIWRRVR